MTRDDEIKLKVATIIDDAVGEKKKARRRFFVWAGSACAVILIASIASALYLNKPPPEPPPNVPQGTITYPPRGPATSREFMIEIPRSMLRGMRSLLRFKAIPKASPLSGHTFYEGGPTIKVTTLLCESLRWRIKSWSSRINLCCFLTLMKIDWDVKWAI